MKRLWFVIVLVPLVCIVIALSGCSRTEPAKNSTKLQVVTTLFPLFDFARTIAGERAEVTMLLPPGMEPHSFEPKPNDIVRISKAGLFIYTNQAMEPWAASILKGIDHNKLQIVNAGQGIRLAALSADDHHHHAGEGDHASEPGVAVQDPHIWLDFGNAATMVDSIVNGFVAADQGGTQVYQANGTKLKQSLAELDLRYRVALKSCDTRIFLHGGHFTFGYLARRYGLEYRSLSGISSESEPSASKMAAMVRQIKTSGTHYLFAEELLSPRLSETLAAEAGVSVLMLHGAHNLGKDDVDRGVGFITLMDRNLIQLQKGLACRK